MINYEQNTDCFKKTENVKSYFRYGNMDFVPKPLFTILIPTYKRTDLLEEALESAIKQWHVPIQWDILILDNEPYNGVPNETELLVKKMNHPRVLYYRNSDNMRPGDNFNRGILLARGKWVMMLHDDDILIDNTLHNIYNIITALEHTNKRRVGAISAKYHQFKYDKDNPESCKNEINAAKMIYLQQPTNYGLYKITHSNVLFTGHIGGDVPSNGTTYNREAVLSVGGFNDDFGISADLVLFYCLENDYDVYSTMFPCGFYRWGHNTMSKPESAYKTVKFAFDFREYVYQKNTFSNIWGCFMRRCQHRRFVMDVLQGRKCGLGSSLPLEQFDNICDTKVNKHIYVVYSLVIRYIYEKVKSWQVKKLYKKLIKEVINNNDRYI